MASIRNIVVVAMMQVGVIVAGVLAAGICHRVWSNDGMAMPGPVALIYGHGFVGLLFPVFWGAGMVTLYLRENISDEIKILAFWFGVLILIVTVVFIIYADATPWLNGPMWHLEGNGDE